jgi:hypothetical protein
MGQEQFIDAGRPLDLEFSMRLPGFAASSSEVPLRSALAVRFDCGLKMSLKF